MLLCSPVQTSKGIENYKTRLPQCLQWGAEDKTLGNITTLNRIKTN